MTYKPSYVDYWNKLSEDEKKFLQEFNKLWSTDLPTSNTETDEARRARYRKNKAARRDALRFAVPLEVATSVEGPSFDDSLEARKKLRRPSVQQKIWNALKKKQPKKALISRDQASAVPTELPTDKEKS